MPLEEDIERLGETTLFKNLTHEMIRDFLTICQKVNFKKNDTIMQEGDIGDSLYIILEGMVEVVKSIVMEDMENGEDTKNKVFTRLKAEDHPVFGEISLLEETKRTATVRALSDCIFLEVKKDRFLEIVKRKHELGCRILLNLARIVSSRLRKADEDIIKLTTVLSIVLKET